MPIIGDIERDAVTEILNIAIGQAASALSLLVEDEVTLSVPAIHFLAPAEAALRLAAEVGGDGSVAVRQRFSGCFAGDILLIFPERRSLDLVRSVMGSVVPLDSLTELEQEALLEVGNIILNACLGSLANQLGTRVESSLPTYVRARAEGIIGASGSEEEELVMFLHVDFALLKKNIDGYLAFVMDIVSAQAFIAAVGEYLRRSLEG